jgi:hypothetical protein
MEFFERNNKEGKGPRSEIGKVNNNKFCFSAVGRGARGRSRAYNFQLSTDSAIWFHCEFRCVYYKCCMCVRVWEREGVLYKEKRWGRSDNVGWRSLFLLLTLTRHTPHNRTSLKMKDGRHLLLLHRYVVFVSVRRAMASPFSSLYFSSFLFFLSFPYHSRAIAKASLAVNHKPSLLLVEYF